ncbi:MAG: hypothetical protein MUP30_08640 [Deltaproteobacteria bacterium]|nr:hypothetical protein [Deltaproteobacteria bacterium]
MKRIVAFLGVVCMVLMAATLVSAQTPLLASAKQATVAIGGSKDDSEWLTVKPTASFGFRWYTNTLYTLDAHVTGIGGVFGREYEYDGSPSLYVGFRVPVTFGKRLEVALEGTWAPSVAASRVTDQDFSALGGILGGRDWDASTNGVTGDLQVSYALVKDFYILKALAPIVGLRYDYWRTTYRDPHHVSPGFAVAAPTDMADFYTSTLLPYWGIRATIGGLKTGWFGGDLNVSLLNGWTAWGKVRHREDRNAAGPRIDRFAGDLDSGSYFFDICADYTIFPFALFGANVSQNIFLKYDMFNADGRLIGRRYTSGESDKFDFKMNRSSITGGISAEVTF